MSKDREEVSAIVTFGLVGVVIVVVIASYCYHTIKRSYEQKQEKTIEIVVEEQVRDMQDEENVKKVEIE